MFRDYFQFGAEGRRPEHAFYRNWRGAIWTGLSELKWCGLSESEGARFSEQEEKCSASRSIQNEILDAEAGGAFGRG